MRKWDIQTWMAREWNLALGCLILVCSLGVSFFHTQTMYERAGADNIYESISLTVATEANFLLAVGNRLYAKAKGRKMSGYANVSFALGLVLIFWSNGTAWANLTWDNGRIVWEAIAWEGAVLGICIPILLWMSEDIIGNQLLIQTKTVAKPTKEVARQDDRIVQEKEPVRQKTDRSDTIKKTYQNRINYLLDDADSQSSEVIAKRLLLQDGKLPSIRRLADEASVSRYQAEMTLKELKKELKGAV